MIKPRLLFIVLWLSLQGRAQTHTPPGFPYVATDSVRTSISAQYEAGLIQRIIMGKNYRSTWNTPVTLPVLYLSKTDLQPVRLGGSKQTKSLYMKDASGEEWVLRSVDKDVSAGVRKPLQNIGMKNLMQDMISALYPYSQVIVAQLARASHIQAASPRIYFVADDKALGEYQSLFAHRVCALEEKAATPDQSDAIDTEKVLEEIKKKNDRLIQQKQVLQARLLDMLVGDWDRHEGQWVWGRFDSSDATYFYAIPRDRDNALFYSDGLLLKLFHHSIWPFYSGFTKKSTHLKKLNYKAWMFDQTFLNEPDAAAWQQAIQQLQQAASDSVIEASVKILPAAAYAKDGAKLIRKLKSRRDGLLKNAMLYYYLLSANVAINGSDEEEIFVISGKGRQLLVSVYPKDKPGQKIYERLFDPAETYCIQLNGLKGNDHFIVEASAGPGIRLQIHGNKGNDIYDIQGKMKIKIYDDRKEDNMVVNNTSARLCF